MAHQKVNDQIKIIKAIDSTRPNMTSTLFHYIGLHTCPAKFISNKSHEISLLNIYKMNITYI